MIDNRRFFNLSARAYEVLVHQDYWRTQIARLLDHVSPREGLRVLDLGCGPGISAFVLAERLGPKATVVGVDLADTMIDRARHHHRTRHARLANVRFEVADATALPLPDGAFDLVTGHSFLYLVPDRPGVLREARRVLAPGGTLVFMEPARGGSLTAAAREASTAAGELWRRPLAASRFTASMVAWRLVSGVAGRLDEAEVRRLFTEAGFVRVECHPTLAGLGLHCVGRT